jgi:hypothetical protein
MSNLEDGVHQRRLGLFQALLHLLDRRVTFRDCLLQTDDLVVTGLMIRD